MVNVKQFEYGLIGVLLYNSNLYDVAGTTVNQLDAGANVNSLTISLLSSPSGIKGGIWLTANPGNYQRLEYTGYSANGDGTYTFNLASLTNIHTQILAGTDAFVERANLPIFDFGDQVKSQNANFIQVKAEKPEQEFPGITGDASNYWKIDLMLAVATRAGKDAERRELSELYAQAELVFVKSMTKSDLQTYSGVQIEGYLQQESEDGMFSDEVQALIASANIKYYYQ